MRNPSTHEIPPSDPLAAFVALVWDSPVSGDRAGIRWDREVPSGSAHVAIRLSGEAIAVRGADGAVTRVAGPVFAGSRATWYERAAPGRTRSVGVVFQPGGAAAWLGIPMDELAGRHWSLADLLGRDAAHLIDRLRDSSDRVATLLAALRARAANARPPDAIVSGAVAELDADGGTVERAWRGSGFSRRHFIARFRRAVGLRPAEFLRVRRFQRAVRLASAATAPSWTRVAQDCGAYDQSHLVREFQAFAGMAPGAFRARRESKSLPSKPDVHRVR